jgi:hypothetical protein
MRNIRLPFKNCWMNLNSIMDRFCFKINVVSSGRSLRRERKDPERTQIKMRRTRKRRERNTMTRRKRMNMTVKVNNLLGIKHRRRCKLTEHSSHK